MLSVAVPVLVMKNACELVVPTTVLVNVTLEFTWIAGAGAGLTVNVADVLVTLPAELLTTTSYFAPLCEVVVADVV